MADRLVGFAPRELRQAMARTFGTRTDERFAMLLDVILAGIAARLAPG